MQGFWEFWEGLFATNRWPARWNCGYWSDFHGWLYIISDLLIWVAYSAIPLIILYFFEKKRAGLRFPKVYFLFAAFILLCGSTHFLDAMMFWVPMYRFNAVIRFATAVVSLATAYHLVRIIPQAFKLKTSGELEVEIQKREEAEQKLAEVNRGLQAFAYVASHDLQEPIRKITTFTTMLYNSNSNQFDDSSKQLSGKIIQSSERMQVMIKDVLNLYSLNEEVKMGPVYLREVVGRALEDLEVKILEKQAEVRYDDLAMVNGHPAYLAQMFINLISNSLKFCQQRPVVEITAIQKGKRVLIDIKDNGIGMEPESTKNIFEPFHRLHGRNEYEGSGIGLAICKKIVDIHKGHISVHSQPGQGTTFTIALPAA